MNCQYCGGDVDDPFWDDTCRECFHEINHAGRVFEPNCQACIEDADDRYEQGSEQLPYIGEFVHETAG